MKILITGSNRQLGREILGLAGDPHEIDQAWAACLVLGTETLRMFQECAGAPAAVLRAIEKLREGERK